MALPNGTLLGPYEILGAIGAGGMGEVYRARDTRLERKVAIKVLPAPLASDADFRERFEREAKSISSLAHPNICTLHDVGQEGDVHFLVLEYLEGESLADRLKKGFLPIREVLRIAIEVASALDAAHRRGIIHRDLKPGNVFLARTAGSSTSTAKLLDFGLAKIRPAAIATGATISMPPGAGPLTARGTILGTFQYMAPEQIEGHEADARADLFSFGATLYEMLTGRQAFDGKTQASLLGAILKDEPAPLIQMQPTTPRALDHVVRTCLAKDPDGRFQTAHDVWLELKWIAEDASVSSGATAPQRAKPPRWALAAWAAALIGVVALASAVTWRLKPQPIDPHAVTRFQHLLPADQNFTFTTRHVVAMAPDGSRLVYAANRQLYLREMNQLEAHPIRGTEDGAGASEPVFSPDGLWLAYFTSVSGAPGGAQPYSLRKVAIAGGAPITLGQLPGAPYGASWRNGMIAFGLNSAPENAYGIYGIPETGGALRPLVSVNGQSERAVQPELLDDGRHIVFGMPSPIDTGRETATGDGPIVVQAIGGGPRTVLVRGGANPHVLSTGHLVYIHDRTIWAVPFDARRLEVKGEAPVPLVDDVAMVGASSAGQFAVSRTGSLVYVTSSFAAASRLLVWVDRQGQEHPIPAAPNTYQQPRLSPDGTRLAVSSAANISIWEFANNNLVRLTNEPATQYNPAWTSDGRYMVFDSNEGEGVQIVRRAADGTGRNERLAPAAAGYPEVVARDQKFLIYHTMPRVAMVLPLDPKGPPRPLLDVKGQVSDVEISPNGQWMAYESTESQRFEIWVRPFPAVDAGRWQISSNGGQHPLWSRDGRELFFIAADGQMMSVPIHAGPTFAHDTPVALFPAGSYWVNVARNYDVSLDGKRFVMVKDAVGPTSRPPIAVVTNWFDEVRARAGKD